ncbi:zinc finger protein 385D isoform X1, partial [Silurus meridionalis]
SLSVGSVCQGGLVPALVRTPLSQVHSSMGLKHFLPISLEASPALNLLPTFNSMDPVQKAVLHHTFGISPLSKRKHVSCNVCQLRFNSQSQAVSHYKGTKHAKKLKSLDVPKCKQKSSAVMRESRKEPEKNLSPSAPPSTTERKEAISDPTHPVVPPSPAKSIFSMASEAEFTSIEEQSPDTTPGAAQDPEVEKESEEEKALRLLYCSLCKVAVNSASQLEAHNTGTKHKTMLEARNGNGSIKSFPRPGVRNKLPSPSITSTGLQNKTFHCETCDVHVNSETQLKQHISSRRHKDRAAGKPAKPKYSPYTKSPKGQTKQQIGNTTVKLPLSKDMGQQLTAAIVPSHLAAVAAAAAAAFPLRASHNPSLFQTQSLPATLLRPAPGPIRTSHAPVLFAPY